MARLLVLLALLLAAVPLPAQQTAQVRIKDLVVLEGAPPVQLTGYGIIVGLDRTGDRATGRRGAPYTVQSIANMLQRFGLTVDPAQLSSRNTAAVMVTATLDPFSGPGTTLDVTISALGDARSLTGGTLLLTPLLDTRTGQVYAMAQGPVSTGAVSASTGGSSVQINHTNTGRVPGGALVQAAPPLQLGSDHLGLVLRRPDFTTANRLAEAINAAFAGAAEVEHAGMIRVAVPGGVGGVPGLMASLERLRVEVDAPARFVINERTGTIVAGGNVRISEVMITYGSIVISTQSDPFVSQPAPLSNGTTVQGQRSTAGISEETARSVVIPPNADVSTLAAALNDLGITPRDIIGIFQAIDRAGALQGELVIM